MSLQYGIKEVMNLQFYDFASMATTPTPLFYVDYAESSEIDDQGTRLDLFGGQGHFKLMSFDHTKLSTLKMNIPLVDLNLLASLSGDTLSTAAQSVYQRDLLTVSGGTATTTKTPLSILGNQIAVYYLSGTRDNGVQLTQVASAPAAGQYSITAQGVLTLNSADNGKEIVCWYQYNTPSTTTKFSNKSNKFPKAMRIIGQGLVRDQATETDVVTAFTFYKAKPKLNHVLTMSGTAATSLQLEFDLYAVQSGSDYIYADYVFLT